MTLHTKAAVDSSPPLPAGTEGRVHTPPRMSGDAVPDRFAGTSQVEIKVTIRAEQEMKTVRLLGLDRSTAESREIYFFDTPQLACFGRNVVLRARLIEHGRDDSTVKIRPVDPARISPLWTRLEGFKLEADVAGIKVVRSASLTCSQKHGEIEDVAAGKRPLRKLFSSEQERFLEVNALVAVPFDALRVLGPISVLRWQSRREGLPGELTAEEWRLPDGTDLLELSVKVDHKDAVRAQRKLAAFLAHAGLDHTGVQEAKTRIALEFFARQATGVRA